ncbi:leucyl aminopeptidase [Pseudooceanicola nanhaiensis]|uniref:leucyl aminopeptidase n=1 Tax=Pseudooceanicola nanhaiensis TaxID=375761 RepID=UPI001CD63983|nr:leucyl aminopeptidase [Pseudooceanicola nanhaiensis]MCA0920921.1 leucyl aminopeptidase [Pseudooceanicola nanhaiensis]
MTTPADMSFLATDLDSLATAKGRIALMVHEAGKMDASARRLNRMTKGAVARLLESDGFAAARPGDVTTLAWPAGLEAEALDVVFLPKTAPQEAARKAGAALGAKLGEDGLLVLAGATRRVSDVALGVLLKAYGYDAQKTKKCDPLGPVRIMCKTPEEVDTAALTARAAGIFFTRDLVNEPANVLTTTEFAARLEALRATGLEVEVLEEDQLAELGMGALLAVGQGSDSPSKVVVMQWKGAGDAAPLALIGKGVVFDTGGISLKPAGGMEDMTMDMGGAGTVAGVMKTLALRKAKANVVGLVGLVENMPSGNATRPGDVITSMKGDTVEVINTDAEGRLVLCDVMWYAQERFKPVGMVDLATLTGAIIIGLGHENAGVFSNDDGFCGQFLSAAKAEGEGAWRMPLGQAYDDQLKSRVADMKNVGGRPAGSITAAQYLKRFVKDETPWIHLDIAGVASLKTPSTLAPKGATGWGVLALDRLVADGFETKDG